MDSLDTGFEGSGARVFFIFTRHDVSYPRGDCVPVWSFTEKSSGITMANSMSDRSNLRSSSERERLPRFLA
jgi:hypothetical protein